MKSYNQFKLNEIQSRGEENLNLPKNFEFIIDISEGSKEDIQRAFEEFEKYTKLDDYIKKILVEKDRQGYPWAWIITIRQQWYGTNYGLCIQYGIITLGKINYSRDPKNMITLKDFIAVGLEGVKEFVDMQENIKKYNL